MKSKHTHKRRLLCAAVSLALVPVALNIYHVAMGTLPAVGAFYAEQLIWFIFAGLFYTYSKK